MSTKYTKYEELKLGLLHRGIYVSDYKEINYGLQFDIELGDMTSKVRIYESKKGIKVDLSTVKYEALKDIIVNIDNVGTSTIPESITSSSVSLTANSKTASLFATDVFENALIGVDESGKGDYFGPLVIAGVYADAAMKRELAKIGAMDSKALTDKKIELLAREIKTICPHDIVTVGCEAYNKIYHRVNNLNKLLAWGHARVIENMLEKVQCQYALSDQFGAEHFIQEALMEKGRTLKLEQKTKGEENIVVAAASILARNEFVQKMEEMNEIYHMTFPKGASSATIQAAQMFVRMYGKENLNKVAKLHFKTTEKI